MHTSHAASIRSDLSFCLPQKNCKKWIIKCISSIVRLKKQSSCFLEPSQSKNITHPSATFPSRKFCKMGILIDYGMVEKLNSKNVLQNLQCFAIRVCKRFLLLQLFSQVQNASCFMLLHKPAFLKSEGKFRYGNRIDYCSCYNVSVLYFYKEFYIYCTI